MKIFHFNTYVHGGAAIGARRIMDSTKSFGTEACFYSVSPPSSLPAYYHQLDAYKPVSGVKRLSQTISWRLYYRNSNKYTSGKLAQYEKFSLINLPVDTPLPTGQGKPDIIHLHWIAEMLDYPSFFKSLPAGIPVVWTLHDMNPFTGGCHYSGSCLRFTNKCGCCPQINGSSEKDITTKIQAQKKELLATLNLHVIGNSHWTQAQAESSTVLTSAKSFQTLQCPINTEEDFYPRDKQVCKEILGIKPTDKVVAFGAFNMAVPRKGLRQLQTALKQLYETDKNLVCIVFGNGSQPNESEGLPPFIYTDFVSSPLLQSIIYSAADIFVIPSLQEAFGQTALEAIACGTPVVGFDGTGVVDIVKEGWTGVLAQQGNEQDLASKMHELLNDENTRVEMGINGRKFAVEHFSFDVLGKKYVDFYRSIQGQFD